MGACGKRNREMTKPNGGAAFPHPHNENSGFTNYVTEPGLSIRDWMAGMAMQWVAMQGMNWKQDEIERVAKCAYELADAMIAEREK